MLQLTVSNTKPMAINSTVIRDVVFMAPSLQDQEITSHTRVCGIGCQVSNYKSS
jgi:hypothetical protein